MEIWNDRGVLLPSLPQQYIGVRDRLPSRNDDVDRDYQCAFRSNIDSPESPQERRSARCTKIRGGIVGIM